MGQRDDVGCGNATRWDDARGQGRARGQCVRTRRGEVNRRSEAMLEEVGRGNMLKMLEDFSE